MRALEDKTAESPRSAQIARWKELTERTLPALAREHRWPLRLDHCFKRVCLDWAFGDVWYRHVPKPAERHIDGEPLAAALRCAEELAAHGEPLLRERNAASLRWRGKGAFQDSNAVGSSPTDGSMKN